MADATLIEWTDATWNPVTGCSVVSPGCTNCYAMKLAGTRLRNEPSRKGLTRDTKAGPVWNGEVRLNEKWLTQPLTWKRPRRIFVCAHGDLFAENVPDEWIDRVFAVMALSPQHTFQVLTKRAARMREYLAHPAWESRLATIAPTVRNNEWDSVLIRKPPSNVWLGVSAEDQARADERIPDLLATPAAVRFVSAEPLLGPIDFDRIAEPIGNHSKIERSALRAGSGGWAQWSESRLDWIIVGGESGLGARPMHPAWARSIRDQCAAAGVPFFFKQWGTWSATYDRDADDPDWRRCNVVVQETPRGRWLNLAGGHGFHGENVVRVDQVGKKAAGRLLDGVEHNAFPEPRI